MSLKVAIEEVFHTTARQTAYVYHQISYDPQTQTYRLYTRPVRYRRNKTVYKIAYTIETNQQNLYTETAKLLQDTTQEIAYFMGCCRCL